MTFSSQWWLNRKARKREVNIDGREKKKKMELAGVCHSKCAGIFSWCSFTLTRQGKFTYVYAVAKNISQCGLWCLSGDKIHVRISASKEPAYAYSNKRTWEPCLRWFGIYCIGRLANGSYTIYTNKQTAKWLPWCWGKSPLTSMLSCLKNKSDRERGLRQ